MASVLVINSGIAYTFGLVFKISRKKTRSDMILYAVSKRTPYRRIELAL